MTLSAHFYIHPWDFYDIGAEVFLDRLVDLGITGVNLAFSHPGISAISPMNPFRTLYYGESGAVFFHPERTSYNWTPMKPRPSREMEDPEYVRFMIEQIQARKLNLWAWVIYACNPHQALEHPRSARIDPFGNPHVAQLSPSSRNFRHYCIGMTEDIMEQAMPDSVILEGLHYFPWDYGLPNKVSLVQLTPYQEFLLGLDFSDIIGSMAKKYRLDPDDLQGKVAATLQESLCREPSEEEMKTPVTEEFLEDKFDGNLSRYLIVREAAASLLFENISRTVRSYKKSVTYAGSLDKFETGLDFFRIRKSIDRYIVKLSDDIRKVEEQVRSIRKSILPASEIIARIDPADFGTKDGFITTLSAMAKTDIHGFSFYNYALLRPEQLDWIAEAKSIWLE